MIIQYIAKENDEGRKLKDILKKRMYISTVLLKKAKYSECIYVNDKLEFVTYIVHTGDKIAVDLDKYISVKEDLHFEDKFELVDEPIDVLYEDEYLLVVNKESNTPTHPSADNYTNTLSNKVASYLKKQGINNVHIVTRLDKNTTGICIFAKNEYVQELFVRRKDEINLKKQYVAIVDGLVQNDCGIIEKDITRMDDTILLRHTVDSGLGDYAKTEYKVIEKNEEENYTVVSVILHTGRTHQIRVHMIDLGHILLGDTLYAEFYKKENIDKLIPRQALHARRITLNHPVTNEALEIVAPIPEDMDKLIKNKEI